MSLPALVPAGVPSRPAVILASPGIATDVAAHAAELTNTPLRSLSLPAETIADVAGIDRTAFVIADPTVIRASEFPWFLQTLTASGIRFGVLFVTDAAQGRAMCRKMLQTERLSSGGESFVVVDTHHRPGADQLSPLVRSSLPSDFAARSFDVIVFSGHSGPLDARAGGDRILCGRADADGYRGPGVFSCYHDGICFRQQGRLPTIAPSAINAKVVVLAGCGTASPGRSLFSAAHNLVQLLLLGRAEAVIASCGVTFKVDELDLLSLSWITEGVPLGEVVRRLNAISNEQLGQNGALPPHVGPFMLFGNPCLRFDGETAFETDVPPETLPATVTVSSAASHYSMPLRAEHAGALSIDIQGRALCRFFLDHERSVLHVWKVPGAPAEFLVNAAVAEDPYLHHRTSIQRAAGNVPFWLWYLASCVQGATRAGEPVDIFVTAQAELTNWTTWAGYAYKRLMSRRYIPVNRRDADELVEREVRPKMKRWNTTLGRCAFDAVAGHRSLPMEQWSDRLLSVGGAFRERTCSCGEADRWGQRFTDLTSHLHRVIYQCTHCGPVGENDGVMRVGFDRISAPARAGDPIEVACSVTAPDNEHLYVAVGAVLDCRGARRSIPGEFVELEVPPGETRRIATSIPVSSDVSPGVYSVWMPAAVNGVLCAESRLVELLPR